MLLLHSNFQQLITLFILTFYTFSLSALDIYIAVNTPAHGNVGRLQRKFANDDCYGLVNFRSDDFELLRVECVIVT